MSIERLRTSVQLFMRDIEYAWRGLMRRPTFVVIVVATLAAGIGANAAVVGGIDTMFFRKLPVPHPERIIAVYSGSTRSRNTQPNAYQSSTLDTYRAIRDRVDGVSGLASYGMRDVRAEAPLDSQPIWTAFISGNYFDVLGVHAQLGRTILPDEENAGSSSAVVVISDFLWRTSFHADPLVLGQRITIGKGRFTVVGVMPAHFTGIHAEGRTNLWIPNPMERIARGLASSANDTQTAGASSEPVWIFGRLASGVPLEKARTSLDRISVDLRAHVRADSVLALRTIIRDRLTTVELSTWGFLWFTMVLAMVVLLHFVACSNVASLMLARAAARRRETGVRLCLGASRGRILRESLLEAAILAALGGAGGLLVGRWLSGLIATQQFLSTTDPGLDLRVVALVAAVTIGTVLQFGLLPAFDASRADPLVVIRGAAPKRRRARDRFGMIVVGQVMVAVILIANATAFLQLTIRQSTSDPGYDANHGIVVTLPLRAVDTTAGNWTSAYDEAAARLASIPGVRAIAPSQGAPMIASNWYGEIVVPGRSVPDAAERPTTALQAVGPGYFAAVGAVMLEGREFSSRDRTGPAAPKDSFDVVIVNESLARREWPNQNPLGKRLGLRAGSSVATVVGVVRDFRDVSSVETAPRAYFPLLERRVLDLQVIVRTSGDLQPMLQNIQSALTGATTFTRPTVATLHGIRDGILETSRIGSSMLAICASIALALTAIGLYGVVSMWAAQRRPEIGIRLALGAPAIAVHRVLMGAMGELVAIGAMLGLFCGVLVIMVERSWMGPIISFGVLPITATVVLVAAVSGITAFVPSFRAARQQPADVLRSA